MTIERARRILAEAESVLVLTGAGVSAESGVPTFRGPEGLWREHRPEELATPGAFARDPALVWEWYEWRRDLVRRCRPNPAHAALAAWSGVARGVWIATQNVDGLHGRALGELSAEARRRGAERLLELHGTLFATRCTGCGARRPRPEPLDPPPTVELPACPDCGDRLRPDVVWFGESLSDAVIGRAFERAERADACLVIGTSAVVQPAAGLARVTHEAGGRVIEVNPEPTPLTPLASESVRETAARAVPAIVPGGPPGS